MTVTGGSTPVALEPGLSYVDLGFQNRSGVIATAVLHGRDGVALVDPGPTSTLDALRAGLAARGDAPADVRAILLTHIHLDHAGSTGVLLDECPRATVFVHERGAPHLEDPSRLIASAGRLYGADMARLWGEIRPVPAGRIRALGERDTLEAAGHELRSAWTPGHAWHHVSYFSPGMGVAFVGDTAGIARPGPRLVLPPTPPPDVDLEAWQASTARILAWKPASLFLTHFGRWPDPRAHFDDLWTRLHDWSARVRADLGPPGEDAARARAFARRVHDELVRAAPPGEAPAYADAARFDYSWHGLARYWRRRTGS